jgi:hypothetical protein
MPCCPTPSLVDAVRIVPVTMQRPSNMAAIGSSTNPRDCGDAPRSPVLRDRLLARMFLIAVVRTGEALAGEYTTVTGESVTPDFNAPPPRVSLWAPIVSVPNPSIPATFEANFPAQEELFSPREFRPRARSILGAEQGASREDVPMLRSATVWQRMAEFRAHNRVRLLTLWEDAAGGSVSLQAGRKGDPSLQWTSRRMNRGGATRGLFDQMFSISVAGTRRGLHLAPRTTAADTAAKPAKLSDGGNK